MTAADDLERRQLVEINHILAKRVAALEEENKRLLRVIEALRFEGPDGHIPWNEVSARLEHVLRRAGITKLAELAAMRERDLRRLKNVGARSVREARDLLARHGMRFVGDQA